MIQNLLTNVKRECYNPKVVIELKIYSIERRVKMNKLNTIDGETLMSRPLQPLNFVVDTLISQGLHILAGSPKVGKSWLAL